MEMPKSIKMFEQLYLGYLALGVIQSALIINQIDFDDTSILKLLGFNLINCIIIGGLVISVSRKKILFANG